MTQVLGLNLHIELVDFSLEHVDKYRFDRPSEIQQLWGEAIARELPFLGCVCQWFDLYFNRAQAVRLLKELQSLEHLADKEEARKELEEVCRLIHRLRDEPGLLLLFGGD